MLEGIYGIETSANGRYATNLVVIDSISGFAYFAGRGDEIRRIDMTSQQFITQGNYGPVMRVPAFPYVAPESDPIGEEVHFDAKMAELRDLDKPGGWDEARRLDEIRSMFSLFAYELHLDMNGQHRS